MVFLKRILEKQLNKYLGEFVEGLTRQDLGLSMWGGDVQLNNVMLRKDIFKRYKMPLQLVYGKIGRLSISIPWRSLASKSVVVEIKDVRLVVSKSLKHSLYTFNMSCDSVSASVVLYSLF